MNMKFIIFISFSHFQSTLPLQCGHGLQNSQMSQHPHGGGASFAFMMFTLFLQRHHQVKGLVMFVFNGTNQHVGVTIPRGCRWIESFST